MVKKSESKGYLIDGFPREIKQGKQFERQVSFFYFLTKKIKILIAFKYPNNFQTKSNLKIWNVIPCCLNTFCYFFKVFFSGNKVHIHKCRYKISEVLNMNIFQLIFCL